MSLVRFLEVPPLNKAIYSNVNGFCVAFTPFLPEELRINITTLPTIGASFARNLVNPVNDIAVTSFLIASDFSGVNGSTWAVWSDHTPSAAVPEPGSLALLALGLAGLGFSRKRAK